MKSTTREKLVAINKELNKYTNAWEDLPVAARAIHLLMEAALEEDECRLSTMEMEATAAAGDRVIAAARIFVENVLKMELTRMSPEAAILCEAVRVFNIELGKEHAPKG